MNRIVQMGSFAIVLGTAVALAMTTGSNARAAGPGASAGFDSHRRPACSVADLRGTFGLSSTGSYAGAPFTRGGWETFDGQGHTSGSASNSVGGADSQSTFLGTYTVNPDCTGTITIVDSAFGLPPTHYNIVIVDARREVMGICTDSGANITLDVKKQFSASGQGDQ